MKDHHAYAKEYIGSSDIAGVTVMAYGKDGIAYHFLHFGGDGDYTAYIVDADCIIPETYKLVFSVDGHRSKFYNPDGSVKSIGEPTGWIKTFDDERAVFDRRFGNGCKIYQRGEYGCIIQLL